MDIKTASVKELYNDMSEKWGILSELFSKKDEREKPRLAVFNINYGLSKKGLDAMLNRLWFFAGFKCMPGRMPFESKKDIFRAYLEDSCLASYFAHYNLITFNRHAMLSRDCGLAMAEEVTHSIVQIKGSIVSVEAIATASFNGYSSYLGHKIYSALKLLDIGKFNVEIDEFFPPLGQSRLMGKKMDNYKYMIDEELDRKAYFQPEKTKEERARGIKKIVYYLPAFAGMMLVKQYKHDVRALLREHPSLVNLDGKQVWEMYCKPLLIHGKL